MTLRLCATCSIPYHHEKSTSSLRFTYCSLPCEVRDLGFSMDALERNPLIKKEKTTWPEVQAPSESPIQHEFSELCVSGAGLPTTSGIASFAPTELSS